MGTEIPGGGGRGRLYLSLDRHHQNDSCIKMAGSDESLFSVSFILRDKVTTPALRWAALSHFSIIHCEGQSPNTVTTDHNF